MLRYSLVVLAYLFCLGSAAADLLCFGGCQGCSGACGIVMVHSMGSQHAQRCWMSDSKDSFTPTRYANTGFVTQCTLLHLCCVLLLSTAQHCRCRRLQQQSPRPAAGSADGAALLTCSSLQDEHYWALSKTWLHICSNTNCIILWEQLGWMRLLPQLRHVLRHSGLLNMAIVLWCQLLCFVVASVGAKIDQAGCGCRHMGLLCAGPSSVCWRRCCAPQWRRGCCPACQRLAVLRKASMIIREQQHCIMFKSGAVHM